MEKMPPEQYVSLLLSLRELERVANEQSIIRAYPTWQFALAMIEADPLGKGPRKLEPKHPVLDDGPIIQTFAEAQSVAIQDALDATHGNKTEAAKILGLKRTTLVEKMKRLGMM